MPFVILIIFFSKKLDREIWNLSTVSHRPVLEETLTIMLPFVFLSLHIDLHTPADMTVLLIFRIWTMTPG